MSSDWRLSALLATALARHPTKTAVVVDQHEHTYEDLDTQVVRLATLLSAKGLTGERVAFMLPNGLEILCCYLACFRIGAVAVPINNRYAAPELERALLVAEPKLLFIHASKLSVFSGMQPAGACEVIVVGSDDASPVTAEKFESWLGGGPVEPVRCSEPHLESPAVIFFTSGSTNRPKGVVHTHASALAMLQSTSAAFAIDGTADVIQVAEPQVHVSGFIGSLSVLMHGGTVVLINGFEEAGYVASMRRWRPSLVCTHIDSLAKLIRWPGIARDDFASLRGVFTGGDNVPPTLQRQFIDTTGLPIQIGWGLTEAIWLTLCREPRFEAAECIGLPVGGAELRVIDPQGRDLQTDAVGELCVRGPMVMQGYWRDPDATEAVLQAGWLRTGDSGWRDASGIWWFATRLKELIVRNTSKISPGEVETALNEHPAVLSSGVVGMADPDEGEVPVAYVVLNPGLHASEAEILAFLKERIALYKIPVRVQFLKSLPLTLSGKLDHRALRSAANATLAPGRQ